MDGTFKVVKQPFYQLHSIHAFVKKEEDEKQVPLAYALMSRRSKEDYVQVFRSLRRRLGDPIVEWFMLDFEAATWQAIREAFPGAVIKECVLENQRRGTEYRLPTAGEQVSVLQQDYVPSPSIPTRGTD
ncbi:uncharacterized protein LOC127845779 [Dreissena polymorpha]|uniref:uncharacterized protein LOC127845779 n=1 Tax=Dreissena polymorpha TaxID=45954 RepID=UPI0022654039|nr:uncharacterized protein LOC127845779 [Dreissena polymorpha]